MFIAAVNSIRSGHTPASVEAADADSLHRMASLFMTHNSECTQQLCAAEADLSRLQTLLNDAMSRMASAFGQLSAAPAVDGAVSDASSDVMVTTLQYQDICSQLVTHLRQRLANTGVLVDGLNLPFAAVMAATRGDYGAIESVASRVNDMNAALADLRRLTDSSPVRQEKVECGKVELF